MSGSGFYRCSPGPDPDLSMANPGLGPGPRPDFIHFESEVCSSPAPDFIHFWSRSGSGFCQAIPGPGRGLGPCPDFYLLRVRVWIWIYQAWPGPGPCLDFYKCHARKHMCARIRKKSKFKGEYSHTRIHVYFRIKFIFLASDIYFLYTRQGFLRFSPVLTNRILHNFIRPLG